MDSSFSKWLIAQMKKKGWSQADLARATGLTRQAIANYVDGRMPQDESLILFARVFKFPPELLFLIAHDLSPEDSQDVWAAEQAYKLKKLKPGLRGIAESFIDSMLEGEETPAPKASKPRKNGKHAAA